MNGDRGTFAPVSSYIGKGKIMTPKKIMRSALEYETLTSDERCKLENMQIYTGDCYAEPGYSTDKYYIIVGDFNPTDFDKKGVFGRACDLLGSIAELEWCDEWGTCADCGKLVRTSPDSYFFTPYYVLLNDCEIVCQGCLDHGEYLDSIANDSSKACFPHVDPLEHGWEVFNEGLESGWHQDQTDNPNMIAETIPEGMDYVFKVTETSQFYIVFAVYVRESQ